jgi:hypothetical protein
LNQQSTPLSSTPRHNLSLQLPTLASSLPEKQPPRILETFLIVQTHRQADPAPKTSRSTYLVVRHLPHTPRHDPSSPIQTPASITHSPVVFAPVSRFLSNPQSSQFHSQKQCRLPEPHDRSTLRPLYHCRVTLCHFLLNVKMPPRRFTYRRKQHRHFRRHRRASPQSRSLYPALRKDLQIGNTRHPACSCATISCCQY